jgi:signal transduction histidine kinase
MSRSLVHLSAAGAVAVAAVGLTSFAGWVLDSEWLKAFLSPGITIKTNASIALSCSGLSLLLLLPEGAPRPQRIAGAVLAGIVLAIGALTLTEHVVGWNLGIDERVFSEAPGAFATASPNRMGPPASACFTLLGLALLLLDRPAGRVRFPSQYLALPAILLALLPILGYAYGVQQLYGVARLTGIAAHTALALLVLGLSVLAARPVRSVAALLCREDAAGALARRLLLPALIVPFGVGLIVTAGTARRSYEPAFAVSVMALALMAAMSVLIWWTGRHLGRTAEERHRAEEALRESEAKYRSLAESMRVAKLSAERAQATAEEANSAKDQFLAVLSHELRTPLSPVLTGISLLETESDLSEPGRRVLDVLRRNVELESCLIDDLLDLTRITRGKVELDKRQIELCTILDRAVEVCHPDMEARRLRFDMDYGPGPYIVNADAARLQQVFWNLLKNAIKFTPPGGCVGIRCRPNDGQVIVEVHDSGIGIEPSALSSIFDAFAQAPRSVTRQFGGLGLGLTISKALVDLHDGNIEARSEGPNRGATFSVRVPMIAFGARAAAPGVAGAGARRPAGGRKLRVLLVEDHGDTLDMLVTLLTLEGHVVVTARHVATALETLTREGPFDLIVSDLGLPDRSGTDLMREMRSRGDATPGIALSGYGQESDLEQSRAAGFAAHLVKPADPRSLLEAMHRVVGESAP